MDAEAAKVPVPPDGNVEVPKKKMPRGNAAPGLPHPCRLLVDMRKVYRGRLKDGDSNLSAAQKALLSQFATKTSEFLRDLKQLEKEHSERWAKASEAIYGQKAEVAKPKAEVGVRSADIRELCDRLVEEAAA